MGFNKHRLDFLKSILYFKNHLGGGVKNPSMKVYSSFIRFLSIQGKTALSVLICSAFCISLLTLTGCLKEGADPNASVAPPAPCTGSDCSSLGGDFVDLGFAGVSNAKNIDGHSIKLTWMPATSGDVAGYRIYEVSSDGELSSIQAVDKTKLAFTHTGLTEGSLHSYLVRAFNNQGSTDGNSVIKSAFTFSGISVVTITGLHTARVNFTPSTNFVNFNIYTRPKRDGPTGTWTLQGTALNSNSSYDVQGLLSGTTYEFKVFAVGPSGDEDSNGTVLEGQTFSVSFNPPVPYVMTYKGVILAQAYGESLGSPDGTPKNRQVTISWRNFKPGFLNPLNSYALVRVKKGDPLDMTATTPCTPTTETSCLVGTKTMLLTINGDYLTDNNVGAPPIQYDYAISLMATANWPEELPKNIDTTPYRITVPIPPDNMVLVQRDSVNYERCQLMGRASDPLNHQRCQLEPGTTMIGAVPYNSGPGRTPLNLDTNYYDFGYNFFIDRYKLSCNWTPGNGYNGGPFFGPSDPSNSYGNVGDVYYQNDLGYCFVKTATNWVNMNHYAFFPDNIYRDSLTIDPSANGGYRPPMHYGKPTAGVKMCNSFVDPFYGPKRLPRLRERVSAGAWAAIDGEPDAMIQRDIELYESPDNGTWLNPHAPISDGGEGAFPCPSLKGIPLSIKQASFATPGRYLSGFYRMDGTIVQGGGRVIGSPETINCKSRYGVSDISSFKDITSDQMYCKADGFYVPPPPYDTIPDHSCIGVASPYDSGNKDIDGVRFDGTQSVGGENHGQVAPNYTYYLTVRNQQYGASFFNIALALPLVTNDNGNAIILSNFLDFDGWSKVRYTVDGFRMIDTNGPPDMHTRGVSVDGSYSLGFPNPSDIGMENGFRCVLPAE